MNKTFSLATSIFAAILLLLTSRTAKAAPAIVPDQSIMRLDDLGFYSPGYAFRGGSEVQLPVGWTSGIDSPTGAACQFYAVQNGREAWLLHCPWKSKTGITFQDFTFQIPAGIKASLKGAVALRIDAVGKSDGVTFRVIVDGHIRLDTNRKDSVWYPFDLDLSKYSGKTVSVRYETDPGPTDNSSFDFALWGDRELHLPGFRGHVASRPAPAPIQLGTLVSKQNATAAPPANLVGPFDIEMGKRRYAYHFNVAEGTVRYDWHPFADDKTLFGRVTMTARMTHDTPITVPLASQAAIEWTAPAVLIGITFKSGTLVRTYKVNGQTAHVFIRSCFCGNGIGFEVKCDAPFVTHFSPGDWGPVLRRKSINIPYYSQPVWYLQQENIFANTILDWTKSDASGISASGADYRPLTDGTRNRLHERVVFSAGWHLDEVLPNIPNAPSPYREDLAHRVMLDIWGGNFHQISDRLRDDAANGLGPAAAIIHSWQFGGYDNMLPQHVPANAGLGGDSAMADLVASAKRSNIKVALHENYVDYYTNYPKFSESDIARESNGKDVTAWYNPGTKLQSFAVKPSRILALAKDQSSEVERRYNTPAMYLDVHSAVPPWFHVDFEAGTPGAGKFQTVRSAHTQLWSYERALHHGPVFGEGNNHWYWSGSLDGVEAQFGQGWPDGKGESAPLFVDFDLLKIHPLQLNHGMGYYERWWQKGPTDQRGLLSLMDQYRMQEIAYGHQAFLGGELWHDPSFVWLESNLVPPVTAATVMSSPSNIDYLVGGKWIDSSANAKSAMDWSRLRVRYSGGPTVWANRSTSPFIADRAVVPPNGWWVSSKSLHAGTTLRSGIVSDYAETANSVWANARPASDWAMLGQVAIRPSVSSFNPIAGRTFRAAYAWNVGKTLKTNYHCLVHFVATSGTDGGENIKFQQDHVLSPPTSTWRAGQSIADGPWDITVPSDLPNGDYIWTIGLYGDDGGRIPLQGESDQHTRTVLGTLHVTTDGVTFTAAPSATHINAPVNLSEKVLDFGPVRTNGSVLVKRNGSTWTLTPFPRDRPFQIELSDSRFGHPSGAKVVHGFWTLKLTGATSYHWPAARTN